MEPANQGGNPPPVVRRMGLTIKQVEETRPADPLSLTAATTFKDATEFTKHIINSANPNPYDNYSVVSCTRNKDLEDDKYHEFLTFLVIDRRDQSYSKIFCDRGHSADYTTLGKHNQLPIIQPVKETATESTLLHILPLQTLTFDPMSMPTVLCIAQTLEKTHAIAPEYTQWRYHCYWFAGTVFSTLQKLFLTSRLTNWSYWSANSYLVPKLGKDSTSLQRVQNFDPTKMSHLIRLHGQRRQAMVDVFADENREWRAKWLKNLGLEPDPAGLKIPEKKATTSSVDLDLPELPPEIKRDTLSNKSKSEEENERELDEIATAFVDQVSNKMVEGSKGP